MQSEMTEFDHRLLALLKILIISWFKSRNKNLS